jgi:environmental stress-induced protein Ves
VTVRVLRRDDHLRMPWRNGGGVTAQVACSPDGEGSAQFDWRVSFAEVEHSGEFSTFPGVDRVIVLVEGPAMTLIVDGVRHVLQRHQPFAFDGESDTGCEVRAPTLDLNVMTRRGRVDADVEVLELDQAPLPTRSADDLLVAVIAGEVRVTHDGQVRELRVGDVVASNDHRSLTVDGTGTAAVIGLVHR